MKAPRDNDPPLHAPINAKLAEIGAATATPPPWYAAWAALGPASTDADRLAVYRAVRDAGSVPAEAGFFLVAWGVDLLTCQRAPEGLREAEERLEAIREVYGLGEDAPADADAPPAYREAMEREHDAWDALYAATLEAFGELEMARLFREAPHEFDRHYEAGREFFHGPPSEDDVDADAWLDELLDAVSACVEAQSPMGPLGLRYHEEGGFWELTAYPTPVELVGGRHDGEVVVAGFTVDLDGLRSLFAAVRDFGWDATGLNDPDGPYVWLEGVYRGREVYLRLLAYPPEGEEPGLKVDATPRRRKKE